MFATFKVSPQFESYSARMTRILGDSSALDYKLRIIPNDRDSDTCLNFRLLKRMLLTRKDSEHVT